MSTTTRLEPGVPDDRDDRTVRAHAAGSTSVDGRRAEQRDAGRPEATPANAGGSADCSVTACATLAC